MTARMKSLDDKSERSLRVSFTFGDRQKPNLLHAASMNRLRRSAPDVCSSNTQLLKCCHHLVVYDKVVSKQSVRNGRSVPHRVGRRRHSARPHWIRNARRLDQDCMTRSIDRKQKNRRIASNVSDVPQHQHQPGAHSRQKLLRWKIHPRLIGVFAHGSILILDYMQPRMPSHSSRPCAASIQAR